MSIARDIRSYLKYMFKVALQEMLKAELGYSKGDRQNKHME